MAEGPGHYSCYQLCCFLPVPKTWYAVSMQIWQRGGKGGWDACVDFKGVYDWPGSSRDRLQDSINTSKEGFNKLIMTH